ncbi:MAG: DUF4476 domain-containing protein [Crocinitomicaceae bacterium]|jgi:hypothetical protein
MKSIFLFFSLSACLIATSQSNLSIFNNSGQRFYVILNGIKQNSMAQTNVSVSGIKDGGYSVKLIFEDGKTSDIDKNFFIDSPSDITTKVVFKKGKGKLQLVSMLPTSGAIQNNSVTYRPNETFIYSDQQAVTTNQTNVSPINGNGSNQTVNTTTNSNAQISNATINTPTNNQQMNVNSSSTVTNSSSNASVGNTPQNVQLSVGLNANGLNGAPTEMLNGNVNVNINVNGNLNGSINETQTTQTIQTTQTTITQSQTGTSTMNVNSSQNQSNLNSNPANVSINNNSQNSINSSSNQNLNNQLSNMNSNCTKTISDFDGFMKDLKSQTFEDDKIETIKKDLISSCLYHQQAYKIIETLTFEENRYEIAKYLYARTLDKQLSEKGILPLFTFDSTKMDWREYVRNYK